MGRPPCPSPGSTRLQEATTAETSTTSSSTTTSRSSPSSTTTPAARWGCSRSSRPTERSFETWLVCVIEEKLGEEQFKANDDRYKVAALLGWTWGFTVEYKDNGDGVDDAKDIFAEKGPLKTIDAPSGSWKKALDAVYGTKDKNDRFNVTLGACADCVATPSAPSGALLLGAIVAGWVASRSRRRWSGARHHVQ